MSVKLYGCPLYAGIVVGHVGKTRIGFGRVDRYQIVQPQVCPHCGSLEFNSQPVAVQLQQVAQLVEHPIEIVEYQRHSCKCTHCGQIHAAEWPSSLVPGQDLGVSLQALLRKGWATTVICPCVKLSSSVTRTRRH